VREGERRQMKGREKKGKGMEGGKGAPPNANSWICPYINSV